MFLVETADLPTSFDVKYSLNFLKRLVRKIHVVVERRIAKKCIKKVEVQVVILT